MRCLALYFCICSLLLQRYAKGVDTKQEITWETDSSMASVDQKTDPEDRRQSYNDTEQLNVRNVFQQGASTEGEKPFGSPERIVQPTTSDEEGDNYDYYQDYEYKNLDDLTDDKSNSSEENSPTEWGSQNDNLKDYRSTAKEVETFSSVKNETSHGKDHCGCFQDRGSYSRTKPGVYNFKSRSYMNKPKKDGHLNIFDLATPRNYGIHRNQENRKNITPSPSPENQTTTVQSTDETNSYSNGKAKRLNNMQTDEHNIWQRNFDSHRPYRETSDDDFKRDHFRKRRKHNWPHKYKNGMTMLNYHPIPIPLIQMSTKRNDYNWSDSFINKYGQPFYATRRGNRLTSHSNISEMERSKSKFFSVRRHPSHHRKHNTQEPSKSLINGHQNIYGSYHYTRGERTPGERFQRIKDSYNAFNQDERWRLPDAGGRGTTDDPKEIKRLLDHHRKGESSNLLAEEERKVLEENAEKEGEKASSEEEDDDEDGNDNDDYDRFQMTYENEKTLRQEEQNINQGKGAKGQEKDAWQKYQGKEYKTAQEKDAVDMSNNSLLNNERCNQTTKGQNETRTKHDHNGTGSEIKSQTNKSQITVENTKWEQNANEEETGKESDNHTKTIKPLITTEKANNDYSMYDQNNAERDQHENEDIEVPSKTVSPKQIEHSKYGSDVRNNRMKLDTETSENSRRKHENDDECSDGTVEPFREKDAAPELEDGSKETKNNYQYDELKLTRISDTKGETPNKRKTIASTDETDGDAHSKAEPLNTMKSLNSVAKSSRHVNSMNKKGSAKPKESEINNKQIINNKNNNGDGGAKTESESFIREQQQTPQEISLENKTNELMESQNATPRSSTQEKVTINKQPTEAQGVQGSATNEKPPANRITVPRRESREGAGLLTTLHEQSEPPENCTAWKEDLQPATVTPQTMEKSPYATDINIGAMDPKNRTNEYFHKQDSDTVHREAKYVSQYSENKDSQVPQKSTPESEMTENTLKSSNPTTESSSIANATSQTESSKIQESTTIEKPIINAEITSGKESGGDAEEPSGGTDEIFVKRENFTLIKKIVQSTTEIPLSTEKSPYETEVDKDGVVTSNATTESQHEQENAVRGEGENDRPSLEKVKHQGSQKLTTENEMVEDTKEFPNTVIESSMPVNTATQNDSAKLRSSTTTVKPLNGNDSAGKHEMSKEAKEPSSTIDGMSEKRKNYTLWKEVIQTTTEIPVATQGSTYASDVNIDGMELRSITTETSEKQERSPVHGETKNMNEYSANEGNQTSQIITPEKEMAENTLESPIATTENYAITTRKTESAENEGPTKTEKPMDNAERRLERENKGDNKRLFSRADKTYEKPENFKILVTPVEPTTDMPYSVISYNSRNDDKNGTVASSVTTKNQQKPENDYVFHGEEIKDSESSVEENHQAPQKLTPEGGKHAEVSRNAVTERSRPMNITGKKDSTKIGASTTTKRETNSDESPSEGETDGDTKQWTGTTDEISQNTKNPALWEENVQPTTEASQSTEQGAHNPVNRSRMSSLTTTTENPQKPMNGADSNESKQETEFTVDKNQQKPEIITLYNNTERRQSSNETPPNFTNESDIVESKSSNVQRYSATEKPKETYDITPRSKGDIDAKEPPGIIDEDAEKPNDYPLSEENVQPAKVVGQPAKVRSIYSNDTNGNDIKPNSVANDNQQKQEYGSGVRGEAKKLSQSSEKESKQVHQKFTFKNGTSENSVVAPNPAIESARKIDQPSEPMKPMINAESSSKNQPTDVTENLRATKGRKPTNKINNTNQYKPNVKSNNKSIDSEENNELGTTETHRTGGESAYLSQNNNVGSFKEIQEIPQEQRIKYKADGISQPYTTDRLYLSQSTSKTEVNEIGPDLFNQTIKSSMNYEIAKPNNEAIPQNVSEPDNSFTDSFASSDYQKKTPNNQSYFNQYNIRDTTSEEDALQSNDTINKELETGNHQHSYKMNEKQTVLFDLKLLPAITRNVLKNLPNISRTVKLLQSRRASKIVGANVIKNDTQQEHFPTSGDQNNNDYSGNTFVKPLQKDTSHNPKATSNGFDSYDTETVLTQKTKNTKIVTGKSPPMQIDPIIFRAAVRSVLENFPSILKNMKQRKETIVNQKRESNPGNTKGNSFIHKGTIAGYSKTAPFEEKEILSPETTFEIPSVKGNRHKIRKTEREKETVEHPYYTSGKEDDDRFNKNLNNNSFAYDTSNNK